MHDAPPPPYSLRDPHSPSPAAPSYPPQDITAFNAFIGTPPLVPGPPVRQPSGTPARYSAPNRSPVSPVLTSPTPSIIPQARPNSITGEELERAGFVSAAPYFELRAPVQARPNNIIYHHLSISPDARPDNLPFPQPVERWTSREVDDQDWMTFLNHLFPPHGAEKDSKGGRELEADADLNMGGLHLSNSRSRDQSCPLLGNRPGPSTGGQVREAERLRRVRIEAVAAQWNEGFFGPRGLEVLIDINNWRPPVPVETTPRCSSSNVLQKRPPPELEEGLLHKAVADRKKSHVKLLLDKGGEDLEALNKKGETVLFKAVSRGDKGIVQLLLDNNANPLARPEGSDSPLHLAVQNDKKTILKMLLEKSTVGIEETNSKGETPLYVACRKRQTSCIEVLLDHGANPNARPLGQESMLNMSVTGDYKSIAKLLLQIGVDIEERNKNGETVRIFQVNSSTSLPRAAEHESPLLADPVLSVLSEELC